MSYSIDDMYCGHVKLYGGEDGGMPGGMQGGGFPGAGGAAPDAGGDDGPTVEEVD